MKKIIAAAIAATSISAGAADAQQGYAGLLGGWVGQNSNSWESGVASVGKVKTSYDDGGNFSVFGGYDFGLRGGGSPRVELELSWRESKVKNHKAGGSNVKNPKGKLNERAGFINAFYDFNGNGSNWVPYIGGGIGYGQVEFKNYGSGSTTLLDGSKNLWGYQIVAGVGYDFNPNARVFIDYRFRGYQEAKLKTEAGNNAKITPSSNAVNIGVLFKF